MFNKNIQYYKVFCGERYEVDKVLVNKLLTSKATEDISSSVFKTSTNIADLFGKIST